MYGVVMPINTARILAVSLPAGGLLERLSRPVPALPADILFVREEFGDGGGNDIHAHLVASFAAGRIPDIGIAPEVDVFRTDPFLIARALTTLDILSGGRAGLAPLAEPGGSLDVGFAGAGTDAAYVAEFVEVLGKLWNSWEPGALARDWAANRYVDSTRIRPARHEGAYFSVAGPLPAPAAPQDAPVILARPVPAHAGIVPGAQAVVGAAGAPGVPWLVEITGLGALPDTLPDAAAGLLLRLDDEAADWAELAATLDKIRIRYGFAPVRPGLTLTERLAAAGARSEKEPSHV